MTAYQAASIGSELSAQAVALATRTLNGRVAIYAGAGVSLSDPTSLPSGPEVSRRVYAALRTQFPQLAGVDETNLTAIADALETLPGGRDAMRQASAIAANFRRAHPSYGHEVLALLLLDGVIEVLTTNWDTCIERGSRDERVLATVNQTDLQQISGPSVLKIHGCATQPSTLLVSTADLANPPPWVVDEVRSRLGAATVVFVGIGDIAGYVKQRVEEAIDSLGGVNSVNVVSPSINSRWSDSQWATLAPGLPTDQRIAMTADQFLEQFASAYFLAVLRPQLIALEGAPSFHDGLEKAVDGLSRVDPVKVLSLSRRAAIAPEDGKSVLKTSQFTHALAAVGKLLGDTFEISRDYVLETEEMALEILVAIVPTAATSIQREASQRLESHLSNGARVPAFVVAGGFGWSDSNVHLPTDVAGEAVTGDVVDGPLAGRPRLIRAEEELA